MSTTSRPIIDMNPASVLTALTDPETIAEAKERRDAIRERVKAAEAIMTEVWHITEEDRRRFAEVALLLAEADRALTRVREAAEKAANV